MRDFQCLNNSEDAKSRSLVMEKIFDAKNISLLSYHIRYLREVPSNLENRGAGKGKMRSQARFNTKNFRYEQSINKLRRSIKQNIFVSFPQKFLMTMQSDFNMVLLNNSISQKLTFKK